MANGMKVASNFILTANEVHLGLLLGSWSISEEPITNDFDELHKKQNQSELFDKQNSSSINHLTNLRVGRIGNPPMQTLTAEHFEQSESLCRTRRIHVMFCHTFFNFQL
jgi:hypothetical protein